MLKQAIAGDAKASNRVWFCCLVVTALPLRMLVLVRVIQCKDALRFEEQLQCKDASLRSSFGAKDQYGQLPCDDSRITEFSLLAIVIEQEVLATQLYWGY